MLTIIILGVAAFVAYLAYINEWARGYLGFVIPVTLGGVGFYGVIFAVWRSIKKNIQTKLVNYIYRRKLQQWMLDNEVEEEI